MASSLVSPYFITPTSTTTTSNRQIKPPSATNNKWWTPLFGVPSDPDYIQTTTDTNPDHSRSSSSNNNNKFAPGCFTEEKAKQLRMKTVEMSNFHDVMYHSAIASRLASDVTRRSNGGRGVSCTSTHLLVKGNMLSPMLSPMLLILPILLGLIFSPTCEETLEDMRVTSSSSQK